MPPPDSPPPPHPDRRLARIVFFTVLLTFAASRVLVILIMTRRMPDLFLHLGGTHGHHLTFCWLSLASLNVVDRKAGTRLRTIEEGGPQKAPCRRGGPGFRWRA